MGTFNYDTDNMVDITDHEEDCDCEGCHMDWHNPKVDYAICTKCLYYMQQEVKREGLL